MIGQGELENRASALGISSQHVELDYVLNHLLAAIAEDPGDLIFRGGTALTRVYWPDFRISEDLDFISPGAAPGLERMLRRSTGRAADGTGLALELEFGRPRGDRSRSFVRWSAPWETSGELLIDVVASERAALPVQRRALVLPYSDLSKAAVIPVMDIAEILSNKWLMLDDRDEPRDLFDLWWALTREAIPFAAIASAHRARYGYAPTSASIAQARKLGRAWQQRLAYQLADLPIGLPRPVPLRRAHGVQHTGGLELSDRYLHRGPRSAETARLQRGDRHRNRDDRMPGKEDAR